MKKDILEIELWPLPLLCVLYWNYYIILSESNKDDDDNVFKYIITKIFNNIILIHWININNSNLNIIMFHDIKA